MTWRIEKKSFLSTKSKTCILENDYLCASDQSNTSQQVMFPDLITAEYIFLIVIFFNFIIAIREVYEIILD